MNLLCWNCRGLGKRSAVRDLRNAIKMHSSKIVFLIETKIQSKKWDMLRCNLGFLNCFSVDRVGLSGGLAVLWKEDMKVSIRNFSRFHVDMLVDLETHVRLTLFYGNPNSNMRKQSWKLLEGLSRNWSGPWLVAGDFNEVMFSYEAKGRVNRNRRRMKEFRDCADLCGLMDMGCQGGLFTFSNKRIFPYEAKARLDRVLANMEFKKILPNVKVRLGLTTSSDHLPLVIKKGRGIESRIEKPFHYESMWHRHEKFQDEVMKIWRKVKDQGGNIVDQMKGCAKELIEWNKSTFGNVQRNIKEIDMKLWVLGKMPRHLNTVEDERKLIELREEWLEREEFLWRQRSRVDWLKEGDRNTAFFHAKASHRRSVNRIDKLVYENREVCGETEVIRVIEDYYLKLFTTSGSNCDMIKEEIANVIPRLISVEMASDLIRPYSRDEIKRALFQLAPLKAPGIDGFPAIFYQRFWNVIGDDMIDEVMRFLSSGQLDQRLNVTRITLIPKCKNPSRLEDFRPISICNTLMKVITKVLANRLQGVLSMIISEPQSAFVGDRVITDNIIIAHEVNHYIKNHKGAGKGIMSIKLDMSKAYDRVEWVFLKEALLQLGFPNAWVELIMTCVSTVSYVIKVNDGQTGLITPSRGLRQGDPISPYLFIICADWLSRCLDAYRCRGLIKGIKIARSAPSISHLFFADDSLVFLKADINEAMEVKHVLGRYEYISGQMVNYEKSEVVFSPDVDESIRNSIKQMLCVKEVNRHNKYLGLPTVIGLNKCEVFKEVEEKVLKKLGDWKCKILSFAGREVLVKSSAQAVPVFTMQCFRMPKKLCQRLLNSEINFLWSHGGSRKSIHWVRKEVLMKDKCLGGLGLKDLEIFNSVLLMKQAWRIITKPDILMSRIIKARYFPNAEFFEASLGRRPSHVWRSVFMVRDVFRQGLEISVTGVGWRWKLSSSGLFNCKTAYFLASQFRRTKGREEGEASDCSEIKEFWLKVWRLTIPEKVKCFVWRLFYNALPDARNLMTRGCNLDLNCAICDYRVETVLHVVKDCWVAQVVGRELGINIEVMEFHCQFPADWLWLCAKRLSIEKFRSLVCAIWLLWFNRNLIIHDNRRLEVTDLVAKVKGMLLRCDRWLKGRNVLLQGLWGYCQHNSKDINDFVFYCDGSYEKENRCAGYGVVIRNGELCEGVRAGFREGVENNIDAEGISILKGMMAATDLRCKEAIFVSDCVEAIMLILRGGDGRVRPYRWSERCFSLLEINRAWSLEHILREDNHWADRVAKFARRFKWSWGLLNAIPITFAEVRRKSASEVQ